MQSFTVVGLVILGDFLSTDPSTWAWYLFSLREKTTVTTSTYSRLLVKESPVFGSLLLDLFPVQVCLYSWFASLRVFRTRLCVAGVILFRW